MARQVATEFHRKERQLSLAEALPVQLVVSHRGPPSAGGDGSRCDAAFVSVDAYNSCQLLKIIRVEVAEVAGFLFLWIIE